MRRDLSILALAMLAWPMAASAGEPLVGPLRTGMPFSEVKAAMPEAPWVEVASNYSGKPVELTAVEALPLAGRAYDVTIKLGAYDAYAVRLVHEAPVAAIRDCEQAVKSLAGELEGRFGPFAPASTVEGAEEWIRGAPGGLLRTLGATPQGQLKAGGASRLDHYRSRAVKESERWIGGRPPKDQLSVAVGGETIWRIGKLTCRTGVVFGYQPPRPSEETVAFATLKPITSPTISARHRAAEQAGDLVGESVTVRLDCGLARRQGVLEGCAPPAGTAPELATAARNLAGGYRFDVKALDPDNDVPLRVEVPITLQRSDRRVVSPPEGLVPLTAAEAPLGGTGAIARSYPEAALAREVEARVVALCQIQTDQSLICMPETIDSTAPELFAGTSRKIERSVRARQTLTGGGPSAGHWVQVVVSFRMAQ